MVITRMSLGWLDINKYGVSDLGRMNSFGSMQEHTCVFVQGVYYYFVRSVMYFRLQIDQISDILGQIVDILT